LKVFVLDLNRKALTPCNPGKARKLLKDGKAAVLRLKPFTIILNYSTHSDVEPVAIKIDPGSKKTGFTLVDIGKNKVIYAAELEHRGQKIKNDLETRCSQRSARRNRNTRYRPARWLNRTRPNGWLPPSLNHRVETTMTWVNRFIKLTNVQEIAVERVKFDTQKMMNPEVSGVEYQRGTLHGFEVWEYLLEKFNHQCAYCAKKDVRLEKEHVIPKTKGGSDRVSNLVVSCGPCNQKKGSKDVSEFLKKKPLVLARIKRQLKTCLKDTAAVNATRNKLFVALLNKGFPVETGTGAQTKFNRTNLDLPKSHWIDSACVGDSGQNVSVNAEMPFLKIKAMGHGTRQNVRINKYGFPCAKPKGSKIVNGFQTGDIARLVNPKGKYKGIYVSRISSTKYTGYLKIKVNDKTIEASYKYYEKLQNSDGYSYA
jgi:5-methylcytosine-specific restriction endonuclease McrA